MKHVALCLFLALGISWSAFGIYMEADLRKVPLERLLRNVTRQAEAEPDNAAMWHHLARTHAMAYAQKVGHNDEVEDYRGQKDGKLIKERPPHQPWFGYDPPYVPFSHVKETGSEASNSIAKQHLEKAIEAYRKAIALDPDSDTIHLGLAWCLDQAGKDAEALRAYRAILTKAWEKESKMDAGFGNYLYAETADYAIPLLDPDKDAREIATLKKRRDHLLALPRAVTPIVIPVTEATDLPDLIDSEARVTFDLDGTGRPLEWQWIAPSAAWLVYDPEGSGRITSATQMFGNRTFLLFCQDGYEALALLDDDGDGKVAGGELDGLCLWRDADSDGESHPHEVRPLGEYGIVAFSTRPMRHESGIWYAPEGVVLGDGSTCPSYDVVLEGGVEAVR